MAKMISLRSGKQCGGFELGKAKREITKFKREREKKTGGKYFEYKTEKIQKEG